MRRNLRGESRLFLGFALFASSAVFAQEIPLHNWTVPPYHRATPPGGLTTMTDITGPRAFIPIQPCRVVDTRGNGFTGTYGPPIMAANATRPFDINSAPHCPGIPAEADAYSLNFTVTQTAGAPGDIRVWPTGNPPPPAQITSVLNWTVGNATVANATVMPAGTNGSIDVQVAGTATHLLIDINGYFSDTLGNPANSLLLANNLPGGATATFANSSSANMSTGVLGLAGPAFPRPGNYRAAGLRGEGTLTGVIGISQSEAVAGSLVDGAGGELAFGILGFKSGLDYGVFGQTYTAGVGVRGVAGSGVPFFSTSAAGVRGESYNIGVLGLGFYGVFGHGTDPAGYGVYSSGDAHVAGTFTAAANKGFVQPHPHDASKEVRYISLEGPHTEVYFRGTAQVSHGVTRIPIPQHFRFVADPATYSTLVTPVGAMATVAVVSEGPDGIVVQASRNVKVHYVVYAEREAVRNPDPIIENVHFRPDPDRDVLAHLPESFRQLMIQNGTLNADGTVNMETAKRLGWDKIWEQRSRPAPQPTEP